MPPTRRKLDRKGHLLGANQRPGRGAGEWQEPGQSRAWEWAQQEPPQVSGRGMTSDQRASPSWTYSAMHLVLSCLLR